MVLFSKCDFGNYAIQVAHVVEYCYSCHANCIGFTVVLSSGQALKYNVVLLCATCDLPAKAAVMNCVQFNGYYGCSRCLQEGKGVLSVDG